MPTVSFRRIERDAVMLASPLAVDEALALATAPGGCAGNRYPLFVELDGERAGGFERGTYCTVEFILPGKPGRWRATGEVVTALGTPAGDIPTGLGLELVGLALTSDAVPTTPEGGSEGGSTADPAATVESAEDALPRPEDWDPTEFELVANDVSTMLGDLLGREVVPRYSDKLARGLGEHDLVASYRDDNGERIFLICLDRAGAVRVGCALMMTGPELVERLVATEGPLEGDELENAQEVLNVMSTLFHEAHSPHVTFSETAWGKDLPEAVGGSLQAVLDAKSWSVCLSIEIEEYGPAEIYLVAK